MFALASLVAVSPEAEEKVAAYWVAQEAKEAAWSQYEQLMQAHQRRQALAVHEGRRVRRPKELVQAEARFDHLEHQASWAAAEVEMALRAANPGAEQRSVMATKRALLSVRPS